MPKIMVHLYYSLAILGKKKMIDIHQISIIMKQTIFIGDMFTDVKWLYL